MPKTLAVPHETGLSDFVIGWPFFDMRFLARSKKCQVYAKPGEAEEITTNKVEV
jgi:hypothetical protein